MTALIIEDEIPAGKRLEKLLLENGFVVLSQLHSVKSVLIWFKENNMPDYVFMDIELADGKCFEIFEKTKIESKVIFTTAYDEYALKAFDYNAIDYLLKPIDGGKLKKMLSKVDVFKEHFLADLESVKNNLSNTYKKSFLVATPKGIKKIMTDEIIGFVSENNATFLITDKNFKAPVHSSLEKLETELDGKQFFRINRKHIINKKFISEINYKNEVVINSLSLISLKISRLKMKAFKEWLKQ
ncbi:DNA-binding LytR/AlgR family response regulator [Flavobacterium arsenatis]|uniref:DNA-binding LytR/AlgR family response regulator n=1 Tax=Flavobacterium arsenatis TaxID=1484332 RepID=A0ABU1TRE0_9FLAO|nr:LytTR family DNA-binding domain-containing protein [Flavobacterium arsenatis]MDR6968439.1 DNA-binding LytR/AlgR family response regulator [Flavobacterium arsenatis]